MNKFAHELRVVDVIEETAEAVTVVFDVPNAIADRFEYLCGQFLTVQIPSESTGSVARCYSLSSSPHSDDRLAITVKRMRGGYASNWLCDNASPGSTLTVLEPAGNFVPSSLNTDVLLCAAGSGITPILSIAKSVLAAGTGRVALVYANEDRGSTIFAAQLADLAARFSDRLTVVHWLVREHGLPSAAGLGSIFQAHPFDDVYICGPIAFMAVVDSALAMTGQADRPAWREEYRSLDANPFERPTDARPADSPSGDQPIVEVEIDGEHRTFQWPRNTTLLDVLLDNGIDAPYVCRESICGTCVCSVRKGRTRMLRNDSLVDEDVDMGLTLACQTLPESDEVYIAFDQ